MNDRIPDLTIEHGDDGSFLLEQDGGSGNVDRIELHPTQVRYLAELAGLLPKSGNRCHSERLESGNGYHPPAPTLARRLRVLRDRIQHMDECLHLVAQQGREDLEHEVCFSLGTWELACEFCADLAEVESDSTAHRASILGNSQDAKPAAPSQMELGA